MSAIRFPEMPGARTILVVEDDAALRILLGQMLSLAGYRPLLAAGSPDALELAQTEESIDLLIADFRMPETSGIGLASRLREDRPALPVLIISGYPVGAIASALDFLAKPFTRDQLVDAVGEILQRRHAAAMEHEIQFEEFIP